MATRRDRRWWKERWVAGHFAQLKSPKVLEGLMDHHNLTCEKLARLASYERIHHGSGKGVSRQMISYLRSGKLKTCEPDLAAAIERVFDLPAHSVFDVLPKSRDTREINKGQAA
jgi:hypothetical protein